MALVEIKHLKKYYNTPRGLLHAIDDVTMDIEKGKTIGIVGESGCGKSTLGKTLIRMEDATDGEVYFDGKEVTHMSQHEFKNMRMRMQMIFQDPYASLDPRMSVSQLIAEPIQTYHLAKNKKELDEMVFQLMEEVGLAKRLANSYPHELDGGRRQRIGIARALFEDPEVLVLDEATSGLDPIMRDEMLDVFLEFVQEENHSILLSSHITSDLEKVADYITFIHNGKLITTVSKNDLVYNYAVMRCKESQFLTLDPKDILAYRKRDFQIDVLVSNGKEAQKKYKGVVVDHVSVDEIMLLLVKGERV